MDFDTFLKSVQDGANLKSEEEAELASVATLATLSSHMTPGQVENFATQLPEPLKQKVADGVPQTRRSFSLDQFLSEVQQASGASDRKAAERMARAVMGTLEESISGGEVEDLFSQLPSEFSDLMYPRACRRLRRPRLPPRPLPHPEARPA